MCSFADLLDRNSKMVCSDNRHVYQWKQLIASVADKVSDQSILRMLVYGFGDRNQNPPSDTLKRLRDLEQWDSFEENIPVPSLRFFDGFLREYVLKPNKRSGVTSVPDELPFHVVRFEDGHTEIILITDEVVSMLESCRGDTLYTIDSILMDTRFHIGVRNLMLIKDGEICNV